MNRLNRSIVLTYLGVMLIWAISPAAEIELYVGNDSGQLIDVPVEVTEDAAGNTVIICPQASSLAQTGQPDIPGKEMTVLLPHNVRPDSVQVQLSDVVWTMVGNDIHVLPASPPATRDENGREIIEWPANRTIVDGYDVEVYQRNAFFPATEANLSPVGQMRQYNLTSVVVPLARYNPVTGRLDVLESARVAVTYQRHAANRGQSIRQKRRRPPRFARKSMEKLAVNYSAAAAEYDNVSENGGDAVSSPGIEEQAGGAAAAAETTGYVIITTDAIANASTKLDDFVAHKQLFYYDVQVVTETDYGYGSGDTAAENIRAWLQDHYIDDDIEFVLLIGDPDPTSSSAPMKMTYPIYNNHDSKYPTDFYYADLTGNWDLDGDGYYGELREGGGSGDDFGTGGVNRNCEVMVGRIPYYGSISQLDAILQRMITYELQVVGIEWRKNCLLPMVELSRDDCLSYQLGENIKNNQLSPNGWSYHRIYQNDFGLSPAPETIYPGEIDPEYSSWLHPASASTVYGVWSVNNFGLVVWQTHGSSTSASGVFSTGYADNMTKDHSAFVFQSSCSNAHPETDTNLSYSLLRYGWAIAALGATRTSYYLHNQTSYTWTTSTGGLAYQFARNMVGRDLTCGEALATLRSELPIGDEDWEWRNGLCYNVYGDPSLSYEPKYIVPTITPPSGVFYPNVTVEAYFPVSGWTIHYTTDGSDPDAGDPVYTSPLTFTQSKIFKVRAYENGGSAYSTIATETYTILPSTIYVDDNAPGDPGPGDPSVSDPLENGSSSHPFDAIQEAVNMSVSGITIIVREGTYTGTGNRNIAFNGKNIVLRSTTPTEPQVVQNTVIDCQSGGRGIIMQNAESAGAKLQGLTISNGYTSSGGAGIYCVGASPVIEYCRILNCTAGTHGGGIFLDGGVAGVHHSYIRGCDAIYGGGIYMKNNASPALDHSLIVDNTGTSGAGLCLVSSTATLEQMTVANNAATSSGGVGYVMDSDLSSWNSIFWGNTATSSGATLYLTSASTAQFEYCDVEGGESGFYLSGAGDSYSLPTGCYAADPRFVDVANGNYRLKSQVGHWNEISHAWACDGQTSGAIDTAHPSEGIGAEVADPSNVRKNLGAYGGTVQASRTPANWSLMCDVNNDGAVDLGEWSLLASEWQQSVSNPYSDYDNDGMVVMGDLLLFCEEWLDTTGWAP